MTYSGRPLYIWYVIFIAVSLITVFKKIIFVVDFFAFYSLISIDLCLGDLRLVDIKVLTQVTERYCWRLIHNLWYLVRMWQSNVSVCQYTDGSCFHCYWVVSIRILNCGNSLFTLQFNSWKLGRYIRVYNLILYEWFFIISFSSVRKAIMIAVTEYPSTRSSRPTLSSC